MTTQAQVQDSNTEDQVKFLPAISEAYRGRPVPPATLAVKEFADGEKIVAIWFGGFGSSHNDVGAEFLAIKEEPSTIDDVIQIAMAEAILGALGQQAWFAPTAKLREEGFTFYNLVPAQESNAQVA